MNERIKELKYRAEALAYEEHKANCIKNGRDPSMPHANALNMTFEKFAELIVKECARIIMNGGYWTDILGNRKNASPDEIAQMIKEHFGVDQ